MASVNDDRYDRPADMRLLELQREALGAKSRALTRSRLVEPDGLPTPCVRDDEGAVAAGPIVAATLDAQPRSGLIAGALVTISLAVVNDGDATARALHLYLPLPVATSYRIGTMQIDGKADEPAALELFGDGIALGDLEAGARHALHFKLLVEAGRDDVHLMPHLRAAATAVLGPRAMRLRRAAIATVPRRIETPFYESDDAEHALEAPPARRTTIDVSVPGEKPCPPLPPQAALADVDAPVAAVRPVSSPRAKSAAAKPPSRTNAGPVSPDAAAPATAAPAAALPSEPPSEGSARASSTPPDPASAVPANRKPRKARAKAPVVTGDTISRSTSIVEEIAAVPTPPRLVRIAGRGGPILTLRLGRARHSTLERLFRGPSLGMAAHYLLLNALTTTTALPGDGGDRALATFVSEQETLLSRALIATRLGKNVPVADLGATLPGFPLDVRMRTDKASVAAAATGEVLLLRALDASEPTFLGRMLENGAASSFLRAAHLFVGLMANDVVVPAAAQRTLVGDALRAYGNAATREIGRIFLRAKLSGTPDLFRSTDRAFDDAARAALDALATLYM